MLLTMWDARSDDFDVLRFAREYGIAPQDCWVRGDLDRRNRVHQDSGFRTCLSDNGNASAHIAEIKSFMRANAGILEHLRRAGVHSTLEVGFTIDAPAHVARVVYLDRELLALLAASDLALSAAAYLESEDLPDGE